MYLQVDHATLAGADLTALERALTGVGLKPEYGGPHSNQITHMSLLGFPDGSYIELISTIKAGQTSLIWGKAIAGDGGPCAWAHAVSDIDAAVARVRDAGIPVIGPSEMSRKRPDGLFVDWNLAYLGDTEPGGTLPFLIQDRTPRSRRVQPTPGLADKGVTGVARVVLGVSNLADGVDLFRRAFDLPEPLRQDDFVFGAALAHFPDTPVIVASPLQGSWLTERLDRFGSAPCAYLLGTPDLTVARETFGLSGETSWFGQRLAWFDSEKLHGIRLACLQL